jgi:DNA mismatch repair protein MutS2
MVLPVIAEHKRKVQGIVHDESASGNILFIEPAEIIQLSNEIKAYEIARKREIERILKKLTEYIAPHREALKQTSKVLATVDFVRAKALFAYQYNAQTPEVDSQPLVFWQNAYHPLLLLHNKPLGLPTIPQQFDLNMDNRIMVISGPNAGGKSVAMKTVALLQFMLQCGFPVTAMNNQKAGVFKQLFIDIGDDQSLDNDLSTYSSHLKNMKYFCDFANGSTLVFIDEFGTGTDPQFGGPIAEAILEELNRKRCFAVVTTHYSNLKLLADKTKGICNAAMAFDTENLKPLYRLEAGKPGSSFAFEVAANIGLPKTIIEKARKKVGQKQKNVDELLVQLEKEKALALASRQKAEAEIVHYDKLKSDYEGLKTGLVDKKNEILAKAKKDALQILNNSNALVEKTIKELKQGNTQNKELRKSIDKEKANLKIDLDNEVSEKKPLQNLALGSLVSMDGQKGIGTILQMSKDRATVAFGNVKTRVNLENLHVVSIAEQQNHLKSNSHRNNNFDTDTQLELDIRGKRAEEALNECIAFVDKGIMSGFEKLRIIHGKGSGILKKVIRGELKKFNAIEKLEDELPEYGGDGITLVYLK